jgi:hypothetical protein
MKLDWTKVTCTALIVVGVVSVELLNAQNISQDEASRSVQISALVTIINGLLGGFRKAE